MLLWAAPRVAEVVAASFVRRGLRLNFTSGKTEVLFQLRGRGAKAAKRDLWQTRAGQFTIQSELLGTFTLHAVRTYPHLGTLLDEIGSIGPELAHREASIHSSGQQLRRRIFGATVEIPKAATLHFADTLFVFGTVV